MELKKLFIGMCLLGTVGLYSCDKDDDDERINEADETFVLKTSVSNTAEIDAATLASTKATNVAVKSYAQSMIAEHSMAQSELKSLGTSVGIAVKDSLDPAHVAIKNQLTALTGRAFDSAYIHVQVADHAATVNTFQTELTAGRHSSVKNYASKYLPHIQMHQQRADSIANAYFKR